MDAEDLTAQWPGDPTGSGYVPVVGEHVFAYRPTDGATYCGWVDDNRMGLFLTACRHGRCVLTASLWRVTPQDPGALCSPRREEP